MRKRPNVSKKLINEKRYPETILRAAEDNDREGSLLLPLSGWVVLTQLCEKLLSHKNIKVSLNTRLESLSQIHSASQPISWEAISSNQQACFSHVVYAQQMIPKRSTSRQIHLPHPIRGQVSFIDIEKAQAACKAIRGIWL